jgi:hypothetical protein
VCPTTTWQSLAPLASAIAGSQTASTCVPPKPAAGSCHGGNYRVVAGGALASGALATPHGTRMLRGNGRIGRAPHTREVLVMVGRSRAPGRTSRGFISALPLSGHSRRATPPSRARPRPGAAPRRDRMHERAARGRAGTRVWSRRLQLFPLPARGARTGGGGGRRSPERC